MSGLCLIIFTLFGTKYSGMDQVKFLEDSV